MDAEILDAGIVKALEGGLEVGNRRYRLLGGSQSMLADHGYYLYARDKNGQSAEDIRCSVGDLEQIRCVASYMARLGLAFSQTQEAIEIESSMIRQDPDITGGQDKSYCFSDGIGRISLPLLKEVKFGVSHVLETIRFILRLSIATP